MVQAETLAGATGRIVSYTIIHVATPEFADEVPYALAIIETTTGERLLARVRDAANDAALRIGASVIFDHADHHGPVFRLS